MQRVDRIFRISLILKGFDGLLELVGGVLLVAVKRASIDHLIIFLMQHELSEDPRDFIANRLQIFAHHLSASSAAFGVIYLVTHGLVKIILVVAVLKQKLWAYPWMIGFLLLFVAYQLYRLSYHFSIGLVALTIFDLFIVWLTWLEFQKRRAVL